MSTKAKTFTKTKLVAFSLILFILLQSFASFTIIQTPNINVYANNTSSSPSTTYKSKIMVSMGDSFSAGEGIPDFYGQSDDPKQKVKSQDWLAHRSIHSWPGQLELPGVSGKMSDHRNTNWYFVATSGAETKHITGKFEKKYNNSGEWGSRSIDAQIDMLNKLKSENITVDYVTLTLGGNDAKFADIIQDSFIASLPLFANDVSAKLDEIWKRYEKTENSDPNYKGTYIKDDLKKAYQDIANAAGPQARIIVAGYPKLMAENGKSIETAVAKQVNDAVSKFNKKIYELVEECKEEGMRICFVPVEDAFGGEKHGAYADDPYLNEISLIPKKEDINKIKIGSAYSMHPNKKGAEIYRKCVQDKIDYLEDGGDKYEWPLLAGSDEREVVLVLDRSSSMNTKTKNETTLLEETKKASLKFVDTVLNEDASIGIVTYDDTSTPICDFSRSKTMLTKNINAIKSGGMTNIEAGLQDAENMLDRSDAKKKIIVLMSDGAPNRGKTGDALINYAATLKEKGIYMYTIGFFANLGGSSKSQPQLLMEKLASEGCHYEVDKAENLEFCFEDIAENIRGEDTIYVRIACPVDVTVSFNGETLTSVNTDSNTRTSFGSLSFEENSHRVMDSSDNRIKILRLKAGQSYDINISGNGTGTMNYTIGFMDKDGEYTDMRKFENIAISNTTKIDTEAKKTKTTSLYVDDDGDGKYDQTLKVEGNDYGEETKKGAEAVKKSDDYIYAVVILTLPPIILILFISVRSIIRYKKRKKATLA